MTFFVDNNLSTALAAGMQAFGEDVVHLQDHFAEDAADSEWLAHIGSEGWYLITRDDRIRYRPSELGAFKEHQVGAFFLAGKNRSRCDLIQQIVRNWPRIKDLAERTRPPFAFRIPPKGTKFTTVSLG